ncbi:MAG TPA: hypothetical protein VFY58_08945 [Nocardioides sp.]|nr:hypothetical protein [Nocardioides sp.]
MAEEVMEDFGPSSGRITGVLGVAICVGIVVLGVAESARGFPPAAVWAALFGGVLFWAALLRPRVRVTESELRLRNMVSTVSVPLAAIEQIVVRQVLSVRAGEDRYVSSAIGKTWRQLLKSGSEREPGANAPYPDFVEERLHKLAEDARIREGIDLMSDGQLERARAVSREWAWPEIVLLGFTALGFVVALLV